MRYIAIILIAMSLMLTACTSGETVSSNNTSSLTVENENIIEGKVSKVNGNEVELNLGKIARPQRENENSDGDTNSTPNITPPNITPSDGTESIEGERRRNTSPEGAQRPSGGSQGRQSMGEGEIPSFGGTTSIELTGESMTIEIPVGTPIYMTVRGSSSKVDFTRLSEDNIVKVSMNDDNKVLSITVVS